METKREHHKSQITNLCLWITNTKIDMTLLYFYLTENFVTKITSTSPFCQSRMFNGRSFDCEFQKWKITRIMGCVCRALTGCSFDGCQCLHWDLEQLWHFICLLFNHMMFASSCLLHVEVGRLVKKLIPLLEGDFCSDGQLHRHIWSHCWQIFIPCFFIPLLGFVQVLQLRKSKSNDLTWQQKKSLAGRCCKAQDN